VSDELFEPFANEQAVEPKPLRRGLGGVLYELIDPNLDGPLRPSLRELAAFGVYLAAGALYVAIGLTTIDFLLSFWVALAYLLVTAWLIPAGVRRLVR
jgi:hypothetical protein